MSHAYENEYHYERTERTVAFTEKMLAGLKQSELRTYQKLYYLLGDYISYSDFQKVAQYTFTELHMTIKEALEQDQQGNWLHLTEVTAIKLRWSGEFRKYYPILI